VVVAARDGVEGLALALVERPDLIITDIYMPVMDGFELARRVRADPELSRTRLMFYTGTYRADEARSVAADLDVAHILTKPAEPQTILDTVNAALDSPPPTVVSAPNAEQDRAYLHLLTNALRRNVEDLKAEILAREQAEAIIRRQSNQARMQAEVSQALAAVTHDYQATLRTVVQHVAAIIGDGCLVRLVSDDGVGDELAALHHPNPRSADLLRDILGGRMLQRAGEDRVGRTIRTGQPALLPTISAEIERSATFSVLIAPLRAAGRVIGAIATARDQPGLSYTADDLALLQDLANRVALAIMNARLYKDVQAEKEALRMSEERLRQVLDGLPMAAYTCDAEGLITYYNPRAAELWAHAPKLNDPADRLCGSAKLLWPDGIPTPHDQCGMAVAVTHGRAVDGNEIVVERSDGSRRSVLAYANPLSEPSGRPAGAVNVLVDITERKHAEAERASLLEAVQASHAQLQALSQQLLQTQEAERRHLARELHDEIGQMLTGLNLLLEVGTAFSIEMLTERLREAQALVANLTTRVRTLSLDLRPSMLDDLGLLPTLLWHFQRYSAQTQVQVRFKHSGLDRALDPTIAVVAYRIVQEALTNVARYACVEAVDVQVWANHTSLGVQVEDQGCGFDRDSVLTARQSGGLTGMQERAALLNGQVIIDSAPGEGTRIIAELPQLVEGATGWAR
jgi:PAS domain S-box-containing protein